MQQVNTMESAFKRAGVCTNPICPYCGKQPESVKGDRIYPHRKNLYDKTFLLCAPCNAYVGCHAKTGEPLGRLADKELRAAKMMAHAAFDPVWQTGRMTRTLAYGWLGEKMAVKPEKCHIGMFDVEQCQKVVEICNQYWRT